MCSKGLRLAFVLIMLMFSMTMSSAKVFGDPTPSGHECPSPAFSVGAKCLCKIHCGNGDWFNDYVTPSDCSGIFASCCNQIGNMSCVP